MMHIFNNQMVPPYLSMLASPPFWALLMLQFGNMWGMYFLLSAAPKFMNEVYFRGTIKQ